ncbi:MAG: hypothetical protein FJX54_21540 [Alphaproteobacteria bacterium]|nr:hypothetical protein [Alphaproteobacteria bacterium]
MNILPTSWVVGFAVAILGLIGLVMAAGALDQGVYLFGLLLFVFAIAFDFWLIKIGYDRVSARRHR